MENKQKLLELLKEVQPITSSEELHGKDGKSGLFRQIAESLMADVIIECHNKQYEILELEFYYYSGNHDDYKTYLRDAKAGQWLIHSYGIDLCFDSSKENKYGGGILIRSIRQVDSSSKAILGPGRTCDELFGVCNAFDTDDTLYIPKIANRHNYQVSLAEPTRRYHITKENKDTRIDFEEMNNSRYTTSDFELERDKCSTLKEKDYFDTLHLDYGATEADKLIRLKRSKQQSEPTNNTQEDGVH